MTKRSQGHDARIPHTGVAMPINMQEKILRLAKNKGWTYTPVAINAQNQINADARIARNHDQLGRNVRDQLSQRLQLFESLPGLLRAVGHWFVITSRLYDPFTLEVERTAGNGALPTQREACRWLRDNVQLFNDSEHHYYKSKITGFVTDTNERKNGYTHVPATRMKTRGPFTRVQVQFVDQGRHCARIICEIVFAFREHPRLAMGEVKILMHPIASHWPNKYAVMQPDPADVEKSEGITFEWAHLVHVAPIPYHNARLQQSLNAPMV